MEVLSFEWVILSSIWNVRDKNTDTKVAQVEDNKWEKICLMYSGISSLHVIIIIVTIIIVE